MCYYTIFYKNTNELCKFNFIFHIQTSKLKCVSYISSLSSNLKILLLNFSWGSGANPWGPEKDDQFSKPNHWDGMLEVVGVTGVVHLGQIQSGLRTAMRIAQVSNDTNENNIQGTWGGSPNICRVCSEDENE